MYDCFKCFIQSAYIASDWWLSRWTNAEENRTRALDALFRDYNRNLTPSLNISNGSSTGSEANVTFNCSAVDFSSLQVVDPIFNLWMYGVLVLIVASMYPRHREVVVVVVVDVCCVTEGLLLL